MQPDAMKATGTLAVAAADANDEASALYSLRLGAIWRQMRREPISFWMICIYLFVEYVRPQSIIPSLNFLPWAKIFLALSAITLFADKQRRWVADPANKWITLFLLAIIVSSLLATYPQFSWAHFMDFFGWFVIYFLIINIVRTEARLLLLLGVFVLCSFKLSLFGAKTWAARGFAFTNWGLQGPPGYFENSGEFAIQMLMLTPVAYELARFLRPHLSWLKYWVLMLVPITGVMSILGASSRGAQLALGYQIYGTLLKGRISIKALVTVGVVVTTIITLLPEEQKARFTTAGDDVTSQQRLLYWKHGVAMIEDNPVLGVGYYNFPRYFALHWPQDMLRGPAYTPEGVMVSELPHNIFVQIGTDTGLTGLLLFGMLIYRTWRTEREIRLMARQRHDGKPFAPLARGLLVSMWGFVIAGQFVTVTYYPFFWINLAFMVALNNVTRRHYLAEPRASAPAPRPDADMTVPPPTSFPG
jgi:putative inorganic carbon (hco3(-)) transporter